MDVVYALREVESEITLHRILVYALEAHFVIFISISIFFVLSIFYTRVNFEFFIYFVLSFRSLLITRLKTI